MNTGSLLKWALIAGAAYLVYRYLDQAGYFGSGTAQALPTGASTTGVTVNSASTVQSSNLLLAPSGATATVPAAQPATPVSAQSPPVMVYAGVTPPAGSPVDSGATAYATPSAGAPQNQVVVMPASWGTIGPSTTPGEAYTIEPMPEVCKNVGSAAQGAQCSAAMSALHGGAAVSLAGYDPKDEALPSMADLLALLGPYRNRWGNA